MLTPTGSPLESFRDSFPPRTPYVLSDVRLEIPDAETAIFTAKTHGPEGASVWARAWVSNEIEGTLAEIASSEMTAGDEVTLTIKYAGGSVPELACMRIESAPLATKHVVHIRLA